MKAEESSRRNFVRKLLSAATLGSLASLLLNEQTRNASAGGVVTYAGDVLYEDENGLPSDPGLYWDNTNSRLGINNWNPLGGPGNPLNQLDVRGDAAFTGPVGIGTNSPLRMLHLYGSGPRILIQDTAGNTSEINFRTKNDTEGSGQPHWSLYEDGSTSDLRFWQTGNKVTLQTGTGYVGIGTTSPTANLHVNGTAVFSGNVGVGTTSPASNLDVEGLMQCVSNVENGAVAYVKNTYPYCPGPICVLTQTCGLVASTENVTVPVLMAGLQGNAYNGAGVAGTSNAGMGVEGIAMGGGAIPVVAQGTSGQTASLQEWQDGSGSALSAIDATGRLGVGTGKPGFNIHAVGTTDPASVTVDGIGIVGPNFMFRRARGTVSSPSAVLQNDGLLFLVAKGYGATGFSAGGRANVSMYAAENWTDTAQGTYMTFKTTQIGTTNQTEKMRITDSGTVVPPLDGAGSLGVNGQRWGLVRAVTVTPGDLVFENGIRATEESDSLVFKNPKGEEIAALDSEGNLYINGEVKNLKEFRKRN